MEAKQSGLFDVVAVSLSTHRIRLIGENESKANAEAIVSMAVVRRGVNDEFFVAVSAGTYKDGAEWRGKEA